jgi:uncharacterized protein YutD
LENLVHDVVINRTLATIRENIQISAKEIFGYYEFEERYSEILDERKQVKLQWLQDPLRINGDYPNIRCETSRHFRSKMREYLKDKINELATLDKNKNIGDM